MPRDGDPQRPQRPTRPPKLHWFEGEVFRVIRSTGRYRVRAQNAEAAQLLAIDAAANGALQMLHEPGLFTATAKRIGKEGGK